MSEKKKYWRWKMNTKLSSKPYFTHGYEKWVPGYEGFYSVNTDGDVFSWKTGFRHKMSPVSGTCNSASYYRVKLVDPEYGVPDAHLIARILAATFMDDWNPKWYVKYKDNNRWNVRLDNLYLAKTSKSKKDINGVKYG